ncbi:putative diguanylate cyclase [compost metagenome]
MAGSAVGQTIVESIGRICRSMGCAAIAEQVEDERSLELLRRAGIEYAQGYAVARPRPLLELL